MRKREDQQRAALLQRITDIYTGACGRVIDFDNDWVSLEEVSRIISALEDVLGTPRKGWFGWEVYCLDRFETPAKAMEHLFRFGFRANKRLKPEVMGDE